MKQEKTSKQQKRWLYPCLLCVWSPLLLFALFIFAGHGFEPILWFRQINQQTEPLCVGESWEEDTFTITLEQLTELPLENWTKNLPQQVREELADGRRIRLYEMQFSFQNISLKGSDMNGKRIDGMYVHTWVCGSDEDGNKDDWPLPECSSTFGIFGLRDLQGKTAVSCAAGLSHCRYVFAVPEQIMSLDVTFRVPAAWGRYYKQEYHSILDL